MRQKSLNNLLYTVNSLWFGISKNGRITTSNYMGQCSQDVKFRFDRYNKLEIYIPDDYLKGRYTTEQIKDYLSFLKGCSFKISYEGISEDWRDRIQKDSNFDQHSKNSFFSTYFITILKVVNNNVFHKFVIKKEDYINATHLMSAFVCLRYTYAKYFNGLVEEIMNLKKLFPRTNNFKLLLLAHYSPSYNKGGNNAFQQSKWGLIGYYSGPFKNNICSYKAFKLLTTEEYLSRNFSSVNLKATESVNKQLDEMTKLFVSKEYKKIINLLK